MTTNRLTLVMMTAAMAVTACSSLMGSTSDLPDRRKFIIEATPIRLSMPTSARPYPYRLEVQEFDVSRLYQRDQIVFRLSPEEIREDRWHVWAVRPSQMVTDAVEQYLRDASLFTDIRQEFIDATPDFTFTGTVNAIERWDSGDLWFARLGITMQVVDRSGQVVWRRTFGEEAERVYNADFSHTVEAMKNRLSRYMAQAIPEIDLQIHVRMLQEQRQPYEHLLIVGRDEAEAAPDTTAAEGSMLGAHPHYEIIHGKLAPETD